MYALLQKIHHSALALLLATGVGLLAPLGLIAAEGSEEESSYWRLNGLTEGARVHAERSPFWQFATGNAKISAGSDLEIPGEGGLINPSIGAITARGLTRFRLPSSDDGNSLEHVQGDVRYYINRSLDTRLEVQTPQLSLSTAGSVFDIEAGVFGTQIDVIDGAVIVATKDRVSEVRLRAGQSARVSSTNLAKLEFRRERKTRFATIGSRRENGNSSDEDRRADLAEPQAPTEGDDTDESRNDAGSEKEQQDAQRGDKSNGDKGKDRGKDKGKGKGDDKGKGKDGDKGKGKDDDKGKGKDDDKGKGKDDDKGKGKDDDKGKGKDDDKGKGKDGDKGKGKDDDKGKGKK